MIRFPFLNVALICLLHNSGCGELDRFVEKALDKALGPESDSWPEQTVSDDVKAILDRGLEIARKRQSLLLVAEVRATEEGQRGRATVRIQWRRPDWLRIDIDVEDEENGKPIKERQTFLHPNNNERWIVYSDAKQLSISEWSPERGRHELRSEPLPWLFPDRFDLRRRRWKIERAEPAKEGMHLLLKAANKDLPLEDAEVWLDPKSGMPRRYLEKVSSSGGLDIRVLRIEENAQIDDSVFKIAMPDPNKGWKIDRTSHETPGAKQTDPATKK